VSRIFLGRWWHWAILVVGAALLWAAGSERMHVIHFNTFVLSVLGVTALVLGAVIRGTRPGEQVTRDPLEAASGTDDDDAMTPRD
jgi:hypothetical protein